MTTRTQIEETLAAQRTRRSKIRPLVAHHNKGWGLISALMVIAVLAASGVAMYLAVTLSTPKLDVIATTSPSANVPTGFVIYPVVSMSPAATDAAVIMQVCTEVPNGRLHVRFAAGEGSEVRGYLIEGETVQASHNSDGGMIQDGQWLHISSPVVGWVNARYVCKQEK
jgi:hypothetical protein